MSEPVENKVLLSALNVGSMVDGIDKAILPVGYAYELRNIECDRGMLRRRRGWTRLFDVRLPFETCINSKNGAYRDGGGRLHRLWAGDDGHLYHALGDNPTGYTLVTLHQDVAWTWDATYRAVFAPLGDDCMITFWQPPEAATVPAAGEQNLRFRGLSDIDDPAGLFHAYGVSIPAPGNAPTLAATAGGDMVAGVYLYFTTFIDVDTGQESDRSDIATITLAQVATPDLAPTVTDAGAGAMGAGTYEYAVAFRDTVTGIRGPLSSESQPLTIAAAHQAALANIRLCPDAGTWVRDIYRRSAGGEWTFLATLADNTTEIYADNAAVAPGPAYAETGQGVDLSVIALYAGGGTPANGRDIRRRIYRSDNGGTSYKPLTAGASEIANNTGTTYSDTLYVPLGTAWRRSVAVPAMGVVREGPDNTLIWLNDRANQLAAQVYAAASESKPEAIAVDSNQEAILSYFAGTHNDPITAAEDVRDGWVIGKRRAIHYMGRTCKNCERILKDRGNVAPGTMQDIDTRVAVLTPEGPGLVDHTSPGDFRFCGSIKDRFCLAETWKNVVKSRLPYASSFHWRDAGCIGWAVQMCASWPVGPHNDTVIMWDYTAADPDGTVRGGRVWIIDFTGVDSFMHVPEAGSDSNIMEACFAYGVAAKLFQDGKNWDGGSPSLLSGTVIAVDGTLVDVDVTALQGQDVVGSVLWVNAGTGSRVCRPVSACENANALIVSVCGGHIRTAGPTGIAAGAGFEIGGYQDVLDFPVNAGNPQASKTFLTVHSRFA